jgi:2-methylcitrate dehydratase PrpD
LKEQATSGLSGRLAQHIAAAEFGRLSKPTRHATKRAVLDGFGVMLAASGTSEDITPFVELARAHGGPAEAHIIGFGDGVSLPMAALANGAMAHALDFEDAFDRAPTHPNASLLPAVMAIAEARGPISGPDFIAAVATGCDLVCRLALSLRQRMEKGGWYPPPIFGAFGATAGAARLLRLNERQITDAFSLLLCQNTCPGEIKYSAETTLRAVREAFPSNAAVLSCLLGERGVRGFDEPLEGKSGFFRLFADSNYDPGTILDGLGRHYYIEELSFKRWPCCRGTHAYIEAAQTLRAVHGFKATDVARVVLIGGHEQTMLSEPEAQRRKPLHAIDAKFSLFFTLAAALLHDEVTLESFSPQNLSNPALLQLAAKVQFELSAQPAAWSAAAGEVVVHLEDGRCVRHLVSHALGDTRRPLDDATLVHKFVACAARAAKPLSGAVARGLAERILALEGESDVGRLLFEAR